MAPGQIINILGSDIGSSIPAGYTAVAIRDINTGNQDIIPFRFNTTAVSATIVGLKNIGSDSVTGTVTMSVIYAKRSIVSDS